MLRFAKICVVVTAGLTVVGCGFSGGGSADSGDSIGVRSFVVNREVVEVLSHDGRDYEVQDITFEYDDGRRETRRYVIVDMRRIGCGGDDCQDALERGVRDQNSGADDY